MSKFISYYFGCLLLFIGIFATPSFGNNLTNFSPSENEFYHDFIMPDTTCGLTDTVFQLTFPSCFGAADATAQITLNGVTGPVAINWDNGVQGSTATGLSAGKHFVTVTTLDGCMLTDSIIIEDKMSLNYEVETIDAMCFGVANGRITITDTSNYIYAWSTGDTIGSIDGLANGNYTVTITDALGCSSSETISVGNTTQAAIELAGTNASCIGINNGMVSVNDTLTLAGYNYVWSTGDSTNKVSDLQPGTYFVLVTSQDGCLAADSIDIGVDREVPLIPTVTNASCVGSNDGAISINDSLDITGFQFGWSNGAVTQSISNLSAGTYSVAIADSLGCIAASTIEVANATTLSISSKVIDGTCDVAENGSIIINDSTDVSGLTFNWSTGDTTQVLANVIPGNYEVTVTDENGCTVSDSITIGITRNLSIGFLANNATCEGVDDGSIIINEGQDLSHLTIVWSTGDSTQSITGLAPTNYSFLVTDTFGCTVFGSPTIGVGTTFGIESTVIDASCDGFNNGSISLNDTIGVADLTISWNTGDSTQTISNLAAGQFIYTVSDSIGCSQTGAIAVNNQHQLTIDLSKTDASCTGLSDGMAMVNNAADSLGLTFAWNTNDSTSNITGLASGIYTVTVTDAQGCSSTESINIVAPSPGSLSLSSTAVSCEGLTDGTAAVIPSDSVNQIAVIWSTGDTTLTISNLATGTYSATVTENGGCISIDSIMVQADSSLQIGLTGNNIKCSGINDGRINASVIGRGSNDGLTFLWNNGETTASILNLAPGGYEVTVTDTTGCIGIGGVNLNPADTIKSILTVVPPACMDTMARGSVIADISGGAGMFSYNWSTGDTTSSIGQLVAGTYILTVTDSEGCIHIDSASLIDPPNLMVTTTETQGATCNGTTDGIADVVVSGGTSPYNINWNTGATTPTLSSLNPGTYTVEVSDAAGCMVQDSVVISQSTSIDLTVTVLNLATGASRADGIATVTATGGQAPYSVNWDNGATGDTVTTLSPGIHSLIVTDSNGCTANDSIEIGFFELFVNFIETRDLRCNGDTNGRATSFSSNGTAPFTYIWSTGDTTPILTTLPGGTHVVTITDAEGKRGQGSITISEPAPIRFNLEITPPGCPNSSNGRIVINATGVVGNPLYDFGFGISPDRIINGISVGFKRFGILDGNGCRADTTFTIEALSPNTPVPNFGVATIGQTATFSDSSSNQPIDYLWKFGDGSTSMEANPVYEYADTGSYEVCLIAGNLCGTDSICQMIRIDPVPVTGVDLIFGRDTSSLAGQVVSIPVFVGAFDEVAGISGAFELTNPMVGTIQGVRALNLPNLIQENIGVQQNLVTIDWQVPDSLGMVSLAAGTQIFVIDVLLTGASNECSQIIANTTESDLQFTKPFNGQLVNAPFTISSSEICIAQTVSIAGNISGEDNIAVDNVTVVTNDSITSITGNDGNYALPGLTGGASYNIMPSKSDDLLAGVSTFDLVRILQHILTQSPLDSPYKIIAADIDNSGNVTSLDLVHLQRLILQQTTAFPNNQPWRFVPKNHVFTNPSNPLVESYPENIQLTNLEIDTANIDFVAIKIGDVIGDNNANGARFSSQPMSFEIKEQSFKAGDIVTIPFNITNKNSNSLGFQFELDFDTRKLAFKEVSKENFLNLTNQNIGLKAEARGQLKLLWVNHQQVALKPTQNGLFQLEFIAKEDGKLSEVLNVGNRHFAAQFYSKEAKSLTVQTIDIAFINNLTDHPTESANLSNMAMMQGGESTIEGGCTDGIDNDMDGLIDCADADCFCECNTATNTAGANLIINPSAEDSINSGGWQIALGNWSTKSTNPEPQEGAAYFYAEDSPSGQLTQVIDLSADSTEIDQGGVTYLFSGYARSLAQIPADDGQILIEYRTAKDSTVVRYDSGTLISQDEWLFLGDTTLAPVGTRFVIINLISRRKNGLENDAYFDNLSLIKLTSENCLEPCAEVDLFTLTTDAGPDAGGSASTTLIGGTGPASYLWNTGDSISEISDLGAGSYTVVVTDSIGCTVTETIEIAGDTTTTNDLTVNLVTTNNICAGDANGSIEVEIVGGTAPYTLVWNDTTLSGNNLQNLLDGNYSVIVTDSTNTSVSASGAITSNSPIVLSSVETKIIEESCPNAGDGQLNIVAEGGTAPYTYILNNDTTDNGVYLNLNAGNYTIHIIDINGCSTADSIVIGNMAMGTLSADFTASTDNRTITFSSSVNDSLSNYAWTFGDSTTSSEMNPSVTYANDGSYEVCLSITNDCGTATSCQTFAIGTITSGPLRFIVNSLNGVSNDTVIIPVTVENFGNIVSYQKTIQIQDTSIARFVGISSPNLAGLTIENFFQIDDHTISNVWYDGTGLGQSVVNNTVIYNLMVLIDSQIDTCVGISIVDNPVPIQVVGIQGNEVSEVPFETTNGEICTQATIQITGNIATETGTPVSGVQIMVSNFDKIPTSDVNGDYLVEKLAIGNAYELTPSLNTPLLENVSTFDIVLINRHILATGLLDSPYKIIAADVNHSGSITVFDMVLIQRAILGLNSNFPGNTAWRFIPKDYQFIDAANPLDEAFPEMISLNEVSGNIANQDFVAIKVADVSYNTPTAGFVTNSRTNTNLNLEINNQDFVAGQIIKIPVSAENIDNLAGFQLELDFDRNALELMQVQPINLKRFDQNNIGLKYLNQGKIQMSWVTPTTEFINGNGSTNLFYLQFKAKVAGNLNNKLKIANRYISSEAYRNDLGIGSVALSIKESKDSQFAEMNLYPNPTTGLINLNFDIKPKELVQVSLYNFAGQLIREWKDVAADNLQINMENQADGTYMIMLKRETSVEVKRIILSR